MNRLLENKNADEGSTIETLFANSLKNYPTVIDAIKNEFSIQGKFESCISTGANQRKTDVIIGFSTRRSINVNVKAYRGDGFNQATRSSIKNFFLKFKILDKTQKELEKLVINKSINPNQPLFPEEELEKWKTLFQPIAGEILKWAFSERPSQEILALFSHDQNKWRIYSMKKTLLNLDKRINFTRGGFNIGNCISFQRKGGNGKHTKDIPKNELRHPGNNIQLKLKATKFISLMEEVSKITEYACN